MQPLIDPALFTILPLVYVAWADGELTTEEADLIRTKSAWLTPPHRKTLDGWLDASTPPTTSDLLRLRRTIREHAGSLNGAERLTLTELGVSMAGVHGTVPGPEVLASLAELEDALAVGSALGDLIPDGRHEQTPCRREPPAFDLDAMSARLDGPQAKLKAEVRKFCVDSGFKHEPEMPKGEQREQVMDWIRTLSSSGYGTYAFPGVTSEATFAEFVSVFDTLAVCDLSLTVKFGVQFGLFGGSIYFLGSDEQHQKYLPDVAAGRLLGCFAMSEFGHGSNVRDLETTATYDAQTSTFVVNTPREAARKEWIGNAGLHGHMATVFAQLLVTNRDGVEENHGVHAVLVPIRDKKGKLADGVRIADCGHKMGLNGVDNGRIWFDQVRVPKENLLARFAQITEDGQYHSDIVSPGRRFFTMIGTLVGGRVAVGSSAVSASKAALSIAVRYSDRRQQFGPEEAPEVPILDYQTHKLRLLPRLARTYALNFAFLELVERYVGKTEEDAREIEAMAAAFKVMGTWHATDVIQACREACGGQGYLSENRFLTLKNDSDIFTTFEGDNTVLCLLVAKSALTDFSQQFAEERVFGLARYLGRRATVALTQTNPVTVRQTDSAHLRSPEFWLEALQFRQDDLVASAAARLRAHMAKGNPFDAANIVGDHMVAVATAYAERSAGEIFWKAVEAEKSPALKAELSRQCTLYALDCIHRDSGWFQEQGYIAGVKARAIRSEISTLCSEIRPQASNLVDAFGISDELLQSHIGRKHRAPTA